MEKDIEKLRKQVERRVGYPLLSARDFNLLSAQIFNMLNVQLSVTTLKRVWGNIEKDSHRQPRMFTLNSLARYVGYEGFEHFASDYGGNTESQSNHLNAASLHIRNLQKGDKLCLTWEPGRRVVVRFEGQDLFSVIVSEKSKLCVGDMFHASLFIQGEPLYLNCLIHKNKEVSNYVCGQRTGINYEIIHHLP